MKRILILLLTSQLAWAQPFGLGLKRDARAFHRFLEVVRKHRVLTGAPVPGSTDLTARVSPPENQGSCGSCWAFSITKALRSAYMLAGRDPGVLAFNYLIDNCGGVIDEMGCDGGDFLAGRNMLMGKGPWLNSQDPYVGNQEQCLGAAPVATAAEWVLVGDGVTPPSFEQLANALSENHMLSIDVAVCGDWRSYQGGIFDHNDCDAGEINHMINLVGYNCESSVDHGNCVFDSKGQPKNGDGYLIVENNWGNSWGENGYMRTRWGADAVATTAMYFDVTSARPEPPTPVVAGVFCGWASWLPWCK